MESRLSAVARGRLSALGVVRYKRAGARCIPIIEGKRWEYEWNPKKAERNLRKHGVEFVDAAIVFDDDRDYAAR